ncbi:CheY-like chemotaxis protein [Massilia aurea]|uniref:CheY-like chemotaxis protein n=2 Tax=Massilia aurea TaxID=373040 RepID=A0A7W9X2Y1_9BURK|nr:CheY-like chemotaxis protein [Massilia aurea]
MPSPAANAPAPEASLHVLVLDDDPLLLDVMREMLAVCGVSNIALETQACSALQRLDQSMPDVVICDLMMPEMDGIEFLQAAAAQGYQGKVILMSALEDGVREAAGELARALGLQVVGSFRKPLEQNQLRAALAC